MNDELSIRGAQQQVDEWIRTIGVRYFSELTNLGILMEEVGELSRLMVRMYGEQSFKESDRDRELGDEMADVLNAYKARIQALYQDPKLRYVVAFRILPSPP